MMSSRRAPARPAPDRIQVRGLFQLAGVVGLVSEARAVMAVTAPSKAGRSGVSKMSYHQAARIGFRARWLAVELAFYLLALLTLGAQIACLLAS
jgi:hypothetical protein